MPVLRSPFTAVVEPGVPVELSADASGAEFRLYVSSVTSRKLNGVNQANKERHLQATTLCVKTESDKRPFAVASLDANQLDSSRVRVVIPVLKHSGKVVLSAHGPDTLVLMGDQHTILSRDQVDTIGSRAAKN